MLFDSRGILLQFFLLQEIADDEPEKGERRKPSFQETAKLGRRETVEIDPADVCGNVKRAKQQPAEGEPEAQPDPPIRPAANQVFD